MVRNRLGRMRVIDLLFLVLFALLSANPAHAHPMDLSQLNISPVGDRLMATLKLHRLAAERFLSFKPSEPGLDESTALFRATIESSVPKMNDLTCQYLRPELMAAPGDDLYLNLQVVITCPKNMNKSSHLVWDLVFLANATDVFQVVVTFSGDDGPVTTVANHKQPRVVIGENGQTFTGFIKMGMCHIGACVSEWRDRRGHLQVSDGIDHIFFILALVLAGGGLWSLAKTTTGFTVGHSLTLALSIYKIIHVHSKWIEVGIAFSIAYVAGRAFLSKASRAESWIIASLFGIVHGLAFSGALQDLDLNKNEVLTALVGFNVGVELGQCFFLGLILLVLALLYRASPGFEKGVRRVLALGVCLTGVYWMYYRGLV